MGLDTSHDCWHGPYSSFSRWREAVQRAAGWHLEERSDGGFRFLWPREIDASALTDANYQGEWESQPEDPLVVLVAHSDCDGVLPVDVLLPLAERLEGLAELMTPTQGQKPDEWLGGAPNSARSGYAVLTERPARATYDGERAATLRFAAGLRRAASLNEPVEFH